MNSKTYEVMATGTHGIHIEDEVNGSISVIGLRMKPGNVPVEVDDVSKSNTHHSCTENDATHISNIHVRMTEDADRNTESDDVYTSNLHSEEHETNTSKLTIDDRTKKADDRNTEIDDVSSTKTNQLRLEDADTNTTTVSVCTPEADDRKTTNDDMSSIGTNHIQSDADNANTTDFGTAKPDDDNTRTDAEVKTTATDVVTAEFHNADAETNGEANTSTVYIDSGSDVIPWKAVTDDEDPQAPDGGWGWVVMAGSFMASFLLGGLQASFDLLLPDLLNAYGASLSVTSLPLAIIVAMFLLMGPLTAWLIRRWGCRPVSFCGGLLAALGVLGSAFCPSIELFIVSFGIVSGAGIGLIFLPSVTMVNIYFNKKRGIVAGIVSSGAGFGTLALAQLTEILQEEYGWRGSYFVMAAIVLHYCVCASVMRPLAPSKRHRKRQSSPEARQDAQAPKSPPPGTSLATQNLAASSPTDKDNEEKKFHSFPELWREHRVFVLFLAGAFLIQLVNNVFPMVTPSYAERYGISKKQTATILSAYGLSNTGGRLLAGALVYWGCRALLVHNVGTFLAGVTCFVFPLCTTFPSITACLALHGLFLGAFPPLQSVLLVEYLGLERLASTFGLLCFVKAFASTAGGPLAGILYAETGRYTTSVVVFGGFCVMTAIMNQLMDCFPKPATAKKTS